MTVSRHDKSVVRTGQPTRRRRFDLQFEDQDHFMKAGLLESRYRTLEEPKAERLGCISLGRST